MDEFRVQLFLMKEKIKDSWLIVMMAILIAVAVIIMIFSIFELVLSFHPSIIDVLF